MNYYQVLGVQQTASHTEIKKAFRRLAVMYHPDKNPDPQAENIFKTINEAYDVLNDPVSRRNYDLAIQGVSIEIGEPARSHRDPAYRPRRPGVYRPSESQRLRELMTKFLPIANKCSWFCFLFCLGLLIDYKLPASVTQESIVNVSISRSYSRNSSTTWWVIHTSGGVTVDLPYVQSDNFLQGMKIEVQASRFLKIPIQVQAGTQRVKIAKTIYGNFIFAPFALLIISALGVAARNNVDYGFNLGVTSFVILMFLIFIILVL